MGRSKGVGVVELKKIFSQKGRALEETLISRLDEDSARIYRFSVEASWIPLEVMASIYETAAGVLYPDEQDGLFKIGEAQAKNQLTGIYRIIMKIINVPYLIEKTAKLWKLYYDQGEAHTEKQESTNLAVMVVTGFPELPFPNRETTRGYVAGAIGLTGGKNVKVTGDYTNPLNWRWLMEWQ
ncbi:hypothetical protein JW933_02830 [candidate division FCPU426 bacterium]|nr:hypothetical protein [candidate division FCPU426 bacterium]